MNPLRYGAIFVFAALLGGCGTTEEPDTTQMVLGNLMTKLSPGSRNAATGPKVSRESLEKLGVSVIVGEVSATGSTYYFVPQTQSGQVFTWTTSDKVTISFRDGIMAATRGIGSDLMESRTPRLAVVRAGRGNTERRYGYLDGNDQMQHQTYSCMLANAGSESLVIFGLQYSARKVTETCQGSGDGFVNEYWFDGTGKLLKSHELLNPAKPGVSLLRVINK